MLPRPFASSVLRTNKPFFHKEIITKKSGVRLHATLFFVRAEHKKNNEQTEALSYVCSLFLKPKSVF